MSIFGLILTQGCMKECPVERKKRERARCMERGFSKERASHRSMACINVCMASRNALESREKRTFMR